jgi:transcriptional regulator with XRE-family HTH domain
VIPRHGGSERVSTKSKLAAELALLGRVIAGVRERAGVKQNELAARLGLPASYLSKIEKGTRRIDVIELINIAAALGMSAATIIEEAERELSKQSDSE